MSLVSSDRPQFWDGSRLLDSPPEWSDGWLVLPEGFEDWQRIRSSVQGSKGPVSLALVNGKQRILVPWQRANPGRYRIEASSTELTWRSTVEVEPRTISRHAFGQLLQELSCRLPASIALALDKCGAHLPINRVSSEPRTLEEELQRLRWTVEGWPDDSSKLTGLRAVLEAMRHAPITQLVREPELRPVERALRPDLTRLGPLLATLPTDDQGYPRRVVDLRPVETIDTPENRFIAHFSGVVARRLRRLIAIAAQVPALDNREISDLFSTTRRAINRVPQLVELAPRGTPPSSLKMFQLPHYRQALGLWRRFRQSLTATLDERLLDAPIDNLPHLYELWATLTALRGTIEAVAELNWTVERHEIFGETPYGFAIPPFVSGRSVLTTRSEDRSLRLEFVPQATASKGGSPLTSISNPMRPDVAVMIWRGPTLESVLLFDPKYKRRGQGPVADDINKMHTYRDAIRGSDQRRVVRYATTMYPGTADRDYSGRVGAISAIPGRDPSPSERVGHIVRNAINDIQRT